MSKSGSDPDNEVEIPHGSYAAGSRVRLPEGAEPPILIFINGVPQTEGSDYDLNGDEIQFRRPIIKEKVGAFRWLIMLLGVIGTYRKNETVDVQFRRGGRTELAGNLDVYDRQDPPAP
ncbi:MAG: hypothetical protein M9938_10425 [Solirubrobacterales bacterium]|nr:hypothetical protein [Solirubrobacterales bacterium]